MNAFVERQVIGLLNEIQALSASKAAAEREEAAEALLLEIDGLCTPRLRSIADDFSLETLVRIPEAALAVPRALKMAEKYFKLFFRHVDSEGLFHIKAHVLYAQLLAQRAALMGVAGEAKLQLIRDGLHHISLAVAAITHERSRKRYGFMVYNISKVLYQMIRVYFRPGQLREFAEVVQLVSQSLAAQLEDEYDWKGFFSWLLFYCLEDTKLGKAESVQILEKLWENSRQTPYFFHEALFRLRVFNSATSAAVWQAIAKEADKDSSGELKVIFTLQSIRTGIIPDNQFEKELTALMRLLLPSKNEEMQRPLSNSAVDLLTEMAHIAAQNGVLSVAEKVVEFLKKKQQLSSKAFVLMEFAKAEMLVRLKAEPAPASKDQQSFALGREIDIEKRREALQVITKAIKVRMGFINPMFVYEGCVKIWNFALPFLNEKRKNDVLKPFQTAVRVLEEIQSSDFHLRLRLHYELARIHLENGNVGGAEEHSRKCQFLLSFCEEAFDFKMVEALIDRVEVVLRPADAESRNLLDAVSEKLRTIQKKEDEDVGADLAEIQRDLSEFNLQSLDFVGSLLGRSARFQQLETDKLDDVSRLAAQRNLAKTLFYKLMVRKCAVYREACQTAFEKNAVEVAAQLATDFIFMFEQFAAGPADTAEPGSAISPKDLHFDIEADQDIQISRVKILFLKAQSLIKKMTDEDVDFALEELVRFNHGTEPLKSAPEEYAQMKTEVVNCFIKGAEVALKMQQTWLIFNAGISIWNAYLPVFKSAMNAHALHPLILRLLEFYFEALRTAVALIEKRKIVDYDLESKVQVYGNISIIYTRLLEQRGDFQRIYAVTEELLLVSLAPQTRKIVNSIRARVGLMLKPEAKGKKQTASLANQTDQTVFEINSKLEVIGNHFQGSLKAEERWVAIRECFDLLLDFHQKQKDQLDAEMLCELWTKLANLALNEERVECTKLALSSLELALAKNGPADFTSLAKSKYTALAKFLYAKALCHLVETPGVERDQHELLLLKSLQMILESVDLCIKIKNPKFLEQVKKFYLVIRTIVEQFYSAENRRCIIQPIFTLIYYLKIAKDTFEGFGRELELSQILLNLAIYVSRGCIDRDDWEMTFMTCNLLLEICVPALKDRVMILKVIAMTRKGLEPELIFEEVKDCSAVLQCTLLQEIAWNAESVQAQYKAFTRAIDIVKKESSGKVFEVILNFKEWMFRNDFPVDNIKKSLHFLEKLIHRKCNGQASGTYLAFLPSDTDDRRRRRSTILPDNRSHQSLEATSLVQLNTADPADEACLYFGSRQASLPHSQRMFGGTPYSPEDCDSLFKVYHITSLIVQDLGERMTYTTSAIFFIWKTWQVIFDDLQPTEACPPRSEDLGRIPEGQTLKALMPQGWRGWLDLQLPASFIAGISKPNARQKFSREAYKQPLITFHYLVAIIEHMFEFCNYENAAFLIKFLELFATHVMDNKTAAQLAWLWSVQLARAAGDHERGQRYLAVFTKNIPLTQAYFVRETAEFSRCYSDAFSKNFELNSLSAKVKKNHFLNFFYVFEFWVAFAEVLFALREYSMAEVLIRNAIPCCIKASAAELLGKCEVMLAAIHSLAGDADRAIVLLESAAKNVKLLKNWRDFISVSVTHFCSIGDVVNPWKVVEKFERLLDQVSPKDSFQYNRLSGRDVQGVLQLLKIELNITEFLLFARNAVIESEAFYCENLSGLLAENLRLFNAFLGHVQGRVSLENLELLIRVLRKCLAVADGIRLLNYNTLNDAYIFLALQLLFFEKVFEGFAETFPLLAAALRRKQAPSRSENASSELSEANLLDPTDFFGFRLFGQLQFVRAQFINVLLDLEAVYRANDYVFPTVQERYLEEKFFGAPKKLQLQVEFEESSDNVVDDYIDAAEYKLSQNIRRSWALIHCNLAILRDLRSAPELLPPGQVHLVTLELDRASQFRLTYKRELTFTKANILSNCELTIHSQESQSASQLPPSTDLEQLSVYPPEVFSLATFGGTDFLRFHQTRCLRSFPSLQFSEDRQLVCDLLEFQDFRTREALAEFYFENVAPQHSSARQFREAVHLADQTRLSALLSKTPVLQRIFSPSKPEEALRSLPKHSLCVILEPHPHFAELFCGAVLTGEDDSQTAFRLLRFKNSHSVLSALQSFLHWAETTWESHEDSRADHEQLAINFRHKAAFLTQSFNDLLVMLLEFAHKATEMLAESRAKTSDKRKTATSPATPKLDCLFFLTSHEFIQAPFALIFEPLAELFTSVAQDLSLGVLASKLQTQTPGKPIVVGKQEGVSLTRLQVPVGDFPELKSMDGISRDLFAAGLDWDGASPPDLTEVQKTLEKKRGLLFFSCTELLSVLETETLLAVAGQTQLDLLLALEKLKVDRPEFKKYNSRFKMTSNYLRIRSLALISALLGNKLSVAVADVLMDKPANALLEALQVKGDQPRCLGEIVDELKFREAFVLIGNPLVAIAGESKKK